MNAVTKIQNTAIEKWAVENPWAAARGIDEPTWSALCNTVYPGSLPDSVLMVVDYCKARKLDPLLKPVHIVPMSVKNSQTDKYEWRDVVMPGVGLYRIQAERSQTYAGADAPEFGPIITKTFVKKNEQEIEVSFPEWCTYTVHKLIGDRIVSYTAKEYWVENYATDSRTSTAPNSMWSRRIYGQLAKCTEAQALRKGWPEIGQEPTAEEMLGKEFACEATITRPEPPKLEYYPAEQFENNFDYWKAAIKAGKQTAESVIAIVQSKGALTEEQKKSIKNCEAIEGESE